MSDSRPSDRERRRAERGARRLLGGLERLADLEGVDPASVEVGLALNGGQTLDSRRPPMDRLLAERPRVLWVAPHPDDEFMSGAILARAAKHHGAKVGFCVLTRGEGGASAQGEDPERLAERRATEMAAVAERFGAELLVQGRYWNAPLPASSFPNRQGIYRRWREDPAGDPVRFVARAIRRFQPDLVLTFDPFYGATAHPEHQAASRVATEAIVMAASAAELMDDGGRELDPHRVLFTSHVLKRHWLWRLARSADPLPEHESFDGALEATPGTRSIDFLCEATKLHESQAKDMAAFRKARRLFTRVGLRHVDPFRQRFAPDG